MSRIEARAIESVSSWVQGGQDITEILTTYQVYNGQYIHAAAHFLFGFGNIIHAIGIQIYPGIIYFRFVVSMDEMVVLFGNEVIELCIEHKSITDMGGKHDNPTKLPVKIDDLVDRLRMASVEMKYCCGAYGATMLASLFVLNIASSLLFFHIHADEGWTICVGVFKSFFTFIFFFLALFSLASIEDTYKQVSKDILTRPAVIRALCNFNEAKSGDVEHCQQDLADMDIAFCLLSVPIIFLSVIRLLA